MRKRTADGDGLIGLGERDRTQTAEIGWKRRVLFAVICCLCLTGVALAQEDVSPSPGPAAAAELPGPGDVLHALQKASDEKAGELAAPIKVLLFFTMLAVLPTALIMVTSFTRIVIVLSFIRRALTTQNIPPAPVIVGLSLFLTLFVMSPTFSRINTMAVQPYLRDEIDLETASQNAVCGLRAFMATQTRESDLALFVHMAGLEGLRTIDDVPTHVLTPAFIVSELRTAFQMGFLLFLPFLMVDLVVASVLLSTGMMMLPPIIISMPFKILLFILVDGWHLVARSLSVSFM